MEWKNDSSIESTIIGICGLLYFPVLLVVLFLMLIVYKTYKTTFQRLIVYYIVLSLCVVFSSAVQIVGAFTETDGRWTCKILLYLFISSQFSWYTYIAAITNFSLFLTVYLTRVRGRPLSKRNGKCVECSCVVSAVTVGLVVASIVLANQECTIFGASLFYTKFWAVSLSFYVGMDLEVMLVSLSLCVYFGFIRQRTHYRQISTLLRFSACLVAVNALTMGLNSFRIGHNIYMWSKNSSGSYLDTTDHYHSTFLIFDAIFAIAIGVFIIIQAILCIQTSTERSICCKRCYCVQNIEDQHHAGAASIGRQTQDSGTNPASSRVSPFSYTNFTVPYTGGFTQVTASAKHGESERRPLIEFIESR